MAYSPSIRNALKRDTLIDILRLIRSENVGPVTFLTLIRQFGSAKAALDAIPSLAAQGGKRKPIACYSKENAEGEIAALTKAGGRFVSIADDDYPTLLTTIYDPPPLISILGHASVWKDKPALAIVGARNASATGCQFARKLASDAGAKKLLVVSGLARGIDTAAHAGSLATGTVAVMASGIGQIYPPENKPLHDSIAQTGCVITEQPFNMAPHSRSFPGRNRIIAGLSQGTVIVEAAMKSGSLITAKFALDQNRDVFAVPGSPLDPRCKGTNHLLRQGAHICESIEDIMENLREPFVLHAGEEDAANYSHNKLIPNDGERSEARRLITSKLGYAPVAIDELLAQCQMTPNLLSLILLELELAGKLQRHPGHKVALTAGDAISEAG